MNEKFDKIGLFPLHLVLFPRLGIKLHIFEERYKSLINRCFKNAETFGINFVDNHKLFDVGCEARPLEIVKRYDDGRMDVSVVGERRYKLVRFSEGEEGYNIGEVKFFKDKKERVDSQLTFECVDSYNAISDMLGLAALTKIESDSLDEIIPSYFIASKIGMSSYQKQNMLEDRSENGRLRTILDQLNRIFRTVNRAQTVDQILKNDGYFSPWMFK